MTGLDGPTVSFMKIASKQKPQREKTVDPMAQYPFLRQLLSPFRKSQQKTLGLVIAAITHAGQARSFAIATVMARWTRVRLDSAINRFYRLLRNHRIDYTLFVQQWARQLAKRRGGELVVAIDWTEWHHNLRVLAAAVVMGKRAIPLFVQASKKKIRRRSQNGRENTFLRVLADCLKRAEAKAIILCDRGFRRVSWLILLQKLELDFVVRINEDTAVQLENGTKTTLARIPLERGKAKNLGVVPLRSDGAVDVRVIGFWAKGGHEPWWIATSLSGPSWRPLKLYDRRMTIEEQFRDTKGKRFGVKLGWTKFRDCDQLARFCMLLGVAVLIWFVTGRQAAKRQPSLRLVCKKKGPRQSYITIGLRLVTASETAMRLTLSRLRYWLEPPELRQLARCGFGRAK